MAFFIPIEGLIVVFTLSIPGNDRNATLAFFEYSHNIII